MRVYLDFEKPIEEIELRIEEYGQGEKENDPELSSLEKSALKLKKDIYSNLTSWQKCQTARHPDRPYTMDYIKRIANDFIELHGDRRYADDPSIIGGLASVEEESLMIVGHQKGRSTKERIHRNFGQPHPEGYRKAMRLMKMAERFQLPVVTLIDTPGAFPGVGAEERGQSEAIATNLMELFSLKVPVISIVIGEGGSGGALALSVADRIYMLEHSVYSIISPEGCAAILWKKSNDNLTQNEFSKAATALKLTANDLMEFKIIDGIIEEPLGGAHRNPDEMASAIKTCILETLKELKTIDISELPSKRMEKFRGIGVFSETK